MSSSLFAGGDTKTAAAAATTRSLFALVLHAWNLCVLLVVTVALLLLSPAAVVILLPVACLAVSACLLCAIAARILLPFFTPPAYRAREHHRSGVRERKQDCIEVDRAEAPGASDDDASSAEEWHGEGPGQEPGLGFSSSSSDGELSDPCDDEHRRFYFVDTGSYCRTFYDLPAFWRSMEGKPAPGGETNHKRSIYKVKQVHGPRSGAGRLVRERN